MLERLPLLPSIWTLITRPNRSIQFRRFCFGVRASNEKYGTSARPTVAWRVDIAGIRVMTDRSNFWQMVDRTRPSKLRVFGENDLGDCLDYFSEIQADSTLPPNESLTASERLTLIRSELDLRHADARHRRTQRLARWAIAIGMISIVVAVASAVTQYFMHKPVASPLPSPAAAAGFATFQPVASPTPTKALPGESISVTPELIPAPTVTATTAPSPTPAPSVQSRKKRRSKPPPKTKATHDNPIEQILRSLIRTKPTPRPNRR